MQNICKMEMCKKNQNFVMGLKVCPVLQDPVFHLLCESVYSAPTVTGKPDNTHIANNLWKIKEQI